MAGDYGYEVYGYDDGEDERRTPIQKLKGLFRDTAGGIEALLSIRRSPERSEWDEVGDGKYGMNNNEDYYDGGRIRKKGSLKPLVVAGGRIMMAGSVLAGMAYAWLNGRDVAVEGASQPTTAQVLKVLKGISDWKAEAREPDEIVLPGPESGNDGVEDTRPSLVEGGVKVVYDSVSGLPVSYEVEGIVTELDQGEMLRLQQEALDNGLPQLITVVRLPQEYGRSNYVPTSDRPLITELPDDVLSEAELAARGVTVINGDGVQLYLRSEAFAEGAPFDTLVPGSGNDVTIVVVEGSAVDAVFMSGDRYDSVRNLVDPPAMTPEEYRQQQLSIWQSVLTMAEADYRAGVVGLELDRLADSVVMAQLAVKELLGASSEKLAMEVASLYGPAGQYYPDSRTIFVAVGDSEVRNSLATEVVYYFDHEGRLQVTSSTVELTRGGVSRTDPSLGFPRPGDFSWLGEGSPPGVLPDSPVEGNCSHDPDMVYTNVFGGSSDKPTWTLRHEVKHFEHLAAHPPEETGCSYEAHRSEMVTDLAAMKELTEAWKLWEESGFSHDDLYWVVFGLSDGTFIVGQNQSGSGIINQ